MNDDSPPPAGRVTAPYSLHRLTRFFAGAWSQGGASRSRSPVEKPVPAVADLPAFEDDLLTAELASEERAGAPDDLLALRSGQVASREPSERVPSSCLVLGLGALSRGEVLWGRLDPSGGFQLLVRGAGGDDRLVAEVCGYLRRPESLLAIEADGRRFSAEDLLVCGPAAGRPQAEGEPADGEASAQGMRDGLPFLLSHPWDEDNDLPDMLAEASLDVSQDG